MTKAIINVETDEPVLVLVMPLRKCARPAPADERRVITTTAEPVVDNVIPLRRAVGA